MKKPNKKPEFKKPSKSKKPLVGTEFLTFKEASGTWIAAWRRFDLLTQGKTEKQAVERLVSLIGQQAIWDALDGNLKTFGTCPPPPPAVLRDWRKAHKATHANDDKLLLN